jgi:hypothetical protein
MSHFRRCLLLAVLSGITVMSVVGGINIYAFQNGFHGIEATSDNPIRILNIWGGVSVALFGDLLARPFDVEPQRRNTIIFLTGGAFGWTFITTFFVFLVSFNFGSDSMRTPRKRTKVDPMPNKTSPNIVEDISSKKPPRS